MRECRNPRCENVSEYEVCDECFDALLLERGMQVIPSSYEKRWMGYDPWELGGYLTDHPPFGEPEAPPIYAPKDYDG